ncbi:hypothetical protein AGR56_04960 [Clostridium sp. DMHC 10]|uniref:pilus assembly protein PilM n=1 Tax=Clostridium sp. DMHC 10 TaxID=747377 RepID=UPI00069F4A43|nr:pilus assembly protein PilM [Clostridium sp. DMHC 10]KOF56226.1 hypothetical protein AGR56_04960 [Clostridium sp. DMHC 10]
MRKLIFILCQNLIFAKQNYSEDIYKDIKSNFDEIFKAFDRIVKFYTAGKVKKTLDKVFIVGEGAKIYGIEAYLQNFMGTDAAVINNAESIKLKINFNDESEFKHYLNAYGAILRNSKRN